MDEFASQVIDALGGTTAVARLCDVEPPSVSGWRRRGIPKSRMQYLRLAKPDVLIEISNHDLHLQRPDV
ncbi:helix-turn-helix domain-containing protein [Paraburkholderia caribensis]|uniref:helix-turn-helix domain-containing protein n=1 Tax=Paraburkholderia caribensis TaxID=75105 RepID=UPI001CC6D725|nr:helix-turn-helix domain-containing protein [Paraburkholderia caribensis]